MWGPKPLWLSAIASIIVPRHVPLELKHWNSAPVLYRPGPDSIRAHHEYTIYDDNPPSRGFADSRIERIVPLRALRQLLGRLYLSRATRLDPGAAWRLVERRTGMGQFERATRRDRSCTVRAVLEARVRQGQNNTHGTLDRSVCKKKDSGATSLKLRLISVRPPFCLEQAAKIVSPMRTLTTSNAICQRHLQSKASCSKRPCQTASTSSPQHLQTSSTSTPTSRHP